MEILLIAIGLVVGGLIGYLIGKKTIPVTQTQKSESTFVNESERIKSENLAKIRENLATLTDGKIDNEAVRRLLGVSDTTACRYLDDLEKEGLIKQVGTDGPKVFYTKQ